MASTDLKEPDVHFVFQSGDKIPGHKCVLAKSRVFHQMFFGPLRETGDVNIVDCSPESFKEFLQLFYLEDCNLTNDSVLEVIYLSNKYDLARGIEVCSSFMEKIATTDNIFWIFDLAIQFEMHDLSKYCEDEIIANSKTALQTSSFKECTSSTLKVILSNDFLSCDEVDILDAFMDWVLCRTDKSDKTTYSKQLNDWGMNLIRFPSMTLQQFNECMRKYTGLLSSDEITDILAYITTQRPLEIAQRFNINARSERKSCRKWANRNILSCVRYSRKPTTPYSYETFDRNAQISFSSNKAIYLHGIETAPIFAVGTYKYDDENNELKRSHMTVQIEVANSEEVLLSECFALEEGDGKYVEFSKPVIVNRDDDFDIRLTLGLDTCHFYYLRDQIEQHPYAVRLGKGINIQLVYEDDDDCNNSIHDFGNTRDLILELLFERM